MSKSLSISEYFSYFKDKRLIHIFIFGMSSGFPWVLIGSVMSAWLKDEGLSRSMIGLFGIVFGAYSINFLWSPLIDRTKLPVLYKWLGQRRSWILFCQSFIFIGTLLLAGLDLKANLAIVAAICLLIAIASATQDIAIDAFRIDTLSEKESHKATAAAAMATSGWWTGYALLGAIPFYMADIPSLDWPQIYYFLAAVMLLLMSGALFAKEPESNREAVHAELERVYLEKLSSAKQTPLTKTVAWLAVTVIDPFRAFFTKNGVKTALALLAFIFLFKIGEAFLGRMSIVFYKEIGFSNSDIATFSKVGTAVLTIIFTFVGSLFNQKYGIVRGFICKWHCNGCFKLSLFVDRFSWP